LKLGYIENVQPDESTDLSNLLSLSNQRGLASSGQGGDGTSVDLRGVVWVGIDLVAVEWVTRHGETASWGSSDHGGGRGGGDDNWGSGGSPGGGASHGPWGSGGLSTGDTTAGGGNSGTREALGVV